MGKNKNPKNPKNRLVSKSILDEKFTEKALKLRPD